MNKLIVGTLAASAVTAGMYFLGRPITKKRSKHWAFENILPRVRELVAPVAELIPVHAQNGKHKR